jgi:HAD superfamily hydrolase (TIGR01509 family)
VKAVHGAEQVLRHLHDRATLALATGATLSDENDIRLALTRVNLATYFDRIYCIKNTGHTKPSPEFYTYILRDLGANPGQVLMVGDSFENVDLAANRVGIDAVWLNEKSQQSKSNESCQTIHSLPELIPLLNVK